MKRSTKNLRSAFTMIEIMLVVLIITLLLGFAIGKIKGNLVWAQEVTARGDIQTIGTQLMVYQGTNGALPSSEQGIKALITKPSSEPIPRNWRSLLSEMPLDPFTKTEYHYQRPGTHNPDGYDLFSVGADGIAGTADDIGNWTK